ncbi:UPAR/Ly6 domain-containing protein crok [Calliopsis andreniformis]|uniref:UPAR/Ly6 domain-containing protein crok n=1 Tax=Calliopsis andreniformis TaxID=337506 RepID=UPI003FCE8052
MIANRLAPIVTLVLVVLLASIHHGEAIICYQCNSEYDPRCGDPFDPYTLGTVNCSFQPRLEHLSHLEPTICRKITQKVYGKIRVVRGCGYLTDERDNSECLSRSGTHDVQAIYCSCTGDLCNSAESRTPSFLLPLTSILAVVLAVPSLLLSYSFAIPVSTSPYFSIA